MVRSYVWRPSGLETEEFARRRSVWEFEPYLRSPIYHVTIFLLIVVLALPLPSLLLTIMSLEELVIQLIKSIC